MYWQTTVLGPNLLLPSFFFLQIKFYWHPAMPIHLLSLKAAFGLRQQGQVVATEPVWSAKPKIFTLWLFTEVMCGPLD